MSLYKCTQQILKQSSGFDECDSFNYLTKILNFLLFKIFFANFNINKREKITDKNYSNKITKSIYELGSIFKTFTIALAIEKNLVLPETIIKDIPRKIKCSNRYLNRVSNQRLK